MSECIVLYQQWANTMNKIYIYKFDTFYQSFIKRNIFQEYYSYNTWLFIGLKCDVFVNWLLVVFNISFIFKDLLF